MRWVTRAIGVALAAGVLATAGGIAGGARAAGQSAAATPVLTYASGTDPAGTADTVDGVVLTHSGATSGGGVFQAGTPQIQLLRPGLGVVPMAGSGCGTALTNWKAAYDLLGFTVWKIWNHTSFCWSAYKVTSVSGWTDTYTGLGWGQNNISWGWQWTNPQAVAVTIARAHFWTGYSGAPLQEFNPSVLTYINGNGLDWAG